MDPRTIDDNLMRDLGLIDQTREAQIAEARRKSEIDIDGINRAREDAIKQVNEEADRNIQSLQERMDRDVQDITIFSEGEKDRITNLSNELKQQAEESIRLAQMQFDQLAA
jgi:hypothetical protein